MRSRKTLVEKCQWSVRCTFTPIIIVKHIADASSLAVNTSHFTTRPSKNVRAYYNRAFDKKHKCARYVHDDDRFSFVELQGVISRHDSYLFVDRGMHRNNSVLGRQSDVLWNCIMSKNNCHPINPCICTRIVLLC